jgi:hypothetical protein
MFSYYEPGTATVTPAFVDTEPMPFIRGLR